MNAATPHDNRGHECILEHCSKWEKGSCASRTHLNLWNVPITPQPCRCFWNVERNRERERKKIFHKHTNYREDSVNETRKVLRQLC